MIDNTEIDVTENFFKVCKQINPGELSHVNSFDLQDVMTAIELMDPKMDARMQIQRKVIYLNEALEKNLLPLDEISPKLLQGIIDETLSCLVNWLKGDTLGQTVFINMYMHCTDQIRNKTLKGVCEAVKGIIIFIRDVICKASVVEEEDFYISTSRMPLDDNNNNNNNSDNKVTSLLKEADDEFTRTIKQQSPCEPDSIIISLQYRIRFIRTFLLWTKTVKKFLQTPNCKQIKDSIFIESGKYLSTMKGFIEKMKETIANGEPVGKGKKDPSKQPYGLIGFEPYLNQPLLPPAIPRCADIEERQSAMEYLEQLIIKLIHVNQIFTIDIGNEVFTGWDFIQNFGRFGCDNAQQSCVFSRSLLLAFYMMFFTNPQLLIGITIESNSNHFVNNSKIDIIKSSIRQFIRLTGWSDIEATIKLDEKLSIFVGACAENLFQIPITHCLNRSRQRNRLELIIDAHWDLYDECLKVDHIVRSYINQKYHNHHQQQPQQQQQHHQSVSNKRNRDIPPIFSSFVALFQFRTMFDYLISGFELNLYAPQELVSVYFILGENVLKYFLSHYHEIENTQQREQSKLLKAVTNKKSRKLIDREINSNLLTIGNMIGKLKSYYNLTMGMFYLTLALTRDGKLPEMAAVCGKYTRPVICYEKRFSPVISRGWFVESASYRQFVQHIEAINSTKSLAGLYEAAAASFDGCRKSIEKCPSEQFIESTASQLDNIAKNNMIVARILARGSKPGKVVLNFDESKEKAFPLIKL